MRKPRQKVLILNPSDSKNNFTSRHAAEATVDRGRARWADSSKTQIIILADTQARYELSLQSEMRKDSAYWRSVAEQRGGNGEVGAIWRAAGPAPSIIGGPQFRTMQARMVAGVHS